MSAPEDVYEAAFKAVRVAAQAYRRGDPGNRQMLKFAAIEALNCRIEEAANRDAGAIFDVLNVARDIVETTEAVILDESHPDEHAKLVELLGSLFRNLPWLPVLYGPGGKTAGASLADLLQIGKGLPIDYGRKWSLETPLNHFCLRAISITDRVLRMALFGTDVLRRTYPELSESSAEKLTKIADEQKRLGPLSKRNASKWANLIFIPVIKIIDPNLENTPIAKQILESWKVKKYGEKPGNIQSELSKYLVKAIQTIT